MTPYSEIALVDGSNLSFASEKDAIFHPAFSFFHGHFELKVEREVVKSHQI